MESKQVSFKRKKNISKLENARRAGWRAFYESQRELTQLYRTVYQLKEKILEDFPNELTNCLKGSIKCILRYHRDPCSICEDEENKFSEENLAILTCGHLFHRACIDQWKQSGHNTCPICRQIF